jgi:hypothetical protein
VHTQGGLCVLARSVSLSCYSTVTKLPQEKSCRKGGSECGRGLESVMTVLTAPILVLCKALPVPGHLLCCLPPSNGKKRKPVRVAVTSCSYYLKLVPILVLKVVVLEG